jgi:hypothetical protein
MEGKNITKKMQEGWEWQEGRDCPPPLTVDLTSGKPLVVSIQTLVRKRYKSNHVYSVFLAFIRHQTRFDSYRAIINDIMLTYWFSDALHLWW